MPTSPTPAFFRGLWRVADPKITLASAAALVLGAAASFAHSGAISWPWFALTAAGIFCIEAAKNASGEIFDFRSGTDLRGGPDDRSPFSGGKRVLVDRLMTPRRLAWVAAGFYILAAAAGIAIAFAREPRILGLGFLGLAIAYFYHAPPLQLSYRGWGEAAVAVTYGPLLVGGTALVQQHHIPAPALLAAVPLGLGIGAFLWINEFPDAAADAQSGKRTWVVRLGRRRAARVFAWILTVAYASVLVLPAAGVTPAVLLGWAGAPLAWRAVRIARRHAADTPALVPAQAATLGSFVLMAAGMAAGLVLAALHR